MFRQPVPAQIPVAPAAFRPAAASAGSTSPGPLRPWPSRRDPRSPRSPATASPHPLHAARRDRRRDRHGRLARYRRRSRLSRQPAPTPPKRSLARRDFSRQYRQIAPAGSGPDICDSRLWCRRARIAANRQYPPHLPDCAFSGPARQSRRSPGSPDNRSRQDHSPAANW